MPGPGRGRREPERHRPAPGPGRARPHGRRAAAQQAVDAALAKAPGAAYRQVTAVDEAGSTGAFSGAYTLGTHAAAHGPGAVAAGNLLASPEVPAAMVAAFAAEPEAHLGARLIAGLRAGLEAGGEEGPVRSAGVVVLRPGRVAGRRPARRLGRRPDRAPRRGVGDLGAADRRLRHPGARPGGLTGLRSPGRRPLRRNWGQTPMFRSAVDAAVAGHDVGADRREDAGERGRVRVRVVVPRARDLLHGCDGGDRR